jgi:predicted ferric reductase
VEDLSLEEKRYSWLSYLSILTGLLLILHPLATNFFPKFFIIIQLIGIPLTIILSLAAILKKNEKKLLGIVGLILAIIMMIFVSILLYISFNKYSPF